MVYFLIPFQLGYPQAFNSRSWLMTSINTRSINSCTFVKDTYISMWSLVYYKKTNTLAVCILNILERAMSKFGNVEEYSI